MSPDKDPRREIYERWLSADRGKKGPLLPPDLSDCLPPAISGRYRMLWYTYQGLSGLLSGLLKRGWNHTPRPWRMALSLAATELVWEDFAKAYGAVNSWVDICRSLAGVDSVAVVNGTLRELCRRAQSGPLSPHSLLPGRLLEAWEAGGRAPKELTEVLASPARAYWHPAAGKRGSPEGEAVAWEGESAVRLSSGQEPDDVLAGHGGFFQNLSAARVAWLVASRTGEGPILDFCAAPGGKAWQMLRCLNGRAGVVLHEHNPTRRLLLERSPLLRAFPDARLASAEDLAEGSYPAVLLDVPCSNSGVLVRCPEAVRHAWGGGDPFAGVQTAILKEGLRLCRGGGSIFYSTCSIFGEENSGRAEAFARETGLRLSFERQYWPDAEGLHGAYLAEIKS